MLLGRLTCMLLSGSACLKKNHNTNYMSRTKRHSLIPRSNSAAWFPQESTRNRWNVEAVFQAEIFGFFPDKFQSVPVEKHKELTGSRRKKIRKFPFGILLSCSSDFRCFSAGSNDYPRFFPAGSRQIRITERSTWVTSTI